MNNNPVTYAPCPNCQADGHYRQLRSIHGRDTLRVDSDAHSLMGSIVNALVCTNCGHIQLFVDANDYNKQ